MNDLTMELAINLAKKARGKTAPNPMVGAIVTNSKSEIIGRGFHPKAGEPHAEVFAIREAQEKQNDLNDCTLTVTLEPCNHTGRTPPCVDLILKSGIKNIKVGSLDPNPLMQGKSVEKLKSAGLNVELGVLKEDTDKLIRGFTTVIEKGRPFVTLKCASSLDGKIATRSGESKWITGAEARNLAHEERANHDAILVGIGTLLADDPKLSVRIGGIASGQSLKKIILDSRLQTPLGAKIFKSSGEVIIYCDLNFSAERKSNLEKIGAKVIPAPSTLKEGLELNFILKSLADLGVQELIVEGGAKVLGSFVREKLFDRMIYFIAPKILGSESLGAFEGLNLSQLNESLNLTNISTRLIGTDVVIEGTR